MTDKTVDFWKCAATFPDNKETVYPDHAKAQKFDDLGGPGVRVLEYGCGGGADAMSWARRGCLVTYADVVPENVEAAHRRVEIYRLDDLCKPALLEVSDRLPEGHFDVISAHGVLHHIPDPRPVLRAMRDRISDGGHLVVMLYTPKLLQEHEEGIKYLVRTRKISEAEAFGWCTDGKGCPYAKAYSIDEAKTLLAEAGFRWTESIESHKGMFATHHAVPA